MGTNNTIAAQQLDPNRDDRIELYRQRFEDDRDIFTGELRATMSNEDDRKREAYQRRKNI